MSSSEELQLVEVEVQENTLRELLDNYQLGYAFIDKPARDVTELYVWQEGNTWFGKEKSHLHFTVHRLGGGMVRIETGGKLTFRSSSGIDSTTDDTFKWSYPYSANVLDEFDSVVADWRQACGQWINGDKVNADLRRQDARKYQEVWRDVLEAMKCVDDELGRLQR